MPGYFVAHYTINDRDTYAKYPPAVVPTPAQYGGNLLIADNAVEVVEGKPQQVTVVIEFESVEAAQRWYNSPENGQIKHLRISSTEGWAVIAKEFERPAP